MVTVVNSPPPPHHLPFFTLYPSPVHRHLPPSASETGLGALGDDLPAAEDLAALMGVLGSQLEPEAEPEPEADGAAQGGEIPSWWCELSPCPTFP